ncbi:MAG TPA: hypothetical protein VLE96_07055 [Chlamydiales bacterium]|nr:hypothetical protein [Chlamydiales bacterium]
MSYITGLLQSTSLKMGSLEKRSRSLVAAAAFVAISNIAHPNEDSVFIRQVLSLAHVGLDESDSNTLVQHFLQMTVDERNSFMSQAVCLATPDLFAFSRTRLLLGMIQMTPDKRNAFVSQILGLITPNMNAFVRSNLIFSILPMTIDEGSAFVNQVLRLQTPNMDGDDRGFLISALADVNLNEREDVVNHVLSLTTPHMNGRERGILIQRIAQITSEEERQRRVQRAAAELENPRFNLREFEGVAPILVLLETPLDEPVPPRIGMVDIGANDRETGINVHDSDRDMRTRNALELLRTNTGDMSDEETNLAVALFLSYLHSFSDEMIRKKAQFVLSGMNRTPQDFPPLLGDDSFTVAGLKISGEELIARLWRFSQTYTDLRAQDMDREKENVVVSIVKALCQSIESDGHRVCNPGKVQRLVVGVLQGRLEGVDIDHLVLEDVTPVSTKQAIDMFMAVASNKELYVAMNSDTSPEAQERFLTAANRFCEENQNVNRQEFISQILAILDLEDK